MYFCSKLRYVVVLLPLPISNVVKESEGSRPYVSLKPGIFEYREHDFSISFTLSVTAEIW
jgi:hypothetical protein